MHRIGILAGFALFVAVNAGSAWALEVKQLKTATDRLGSRIVEQYDVKEKAYKGELGRDVKTVAIIVTALCNSPRHYREANGPYLSEPVKFLVAQVSGGNDKSLSLETMAWIKLALAATKNEKYEAVLKRLPEAKLPDLQIKVETPTADQEVLTALLYAWYSKTIEKKDATDMAESLMKLQQKNGSISDNIQVNALALELLNLCYSVLIKG
ncbi:MAG: hypothetical protein V1899_12830 [Planctomycetota bacterium]